MEVSVNELNELVFNAYEKGKRECKENEIKGEILTYRGKLCYDTADIIETIICEINRRFNPFDEKTEKIVNFIEDEFLTPLKSPKCVSAER